MEVKILSEIIMRISDKYPQCEGAPLEEVYTEAEKNGTDRAKAEDIIKNTKGGNLLSLDQKHILNTLTISFSAVAMKVKYNLQQVTLTASSLEQTISYLSIS